MNVGALRLNVGTKISADIGTFIQHHTQPAQTIFLLFNGVRHKASLIGVFDAKDELPAGLFGEQVIVERGARAADVQVAGGRGRKAHAGGSDVGH